MPVRPLFDAVSPAFRPNDRFSYSGHPNGMTALPPLVVAPPPDDPLLTRKDLASRW
jgi:hypothetical protein